MLQIARAGAVQMLLWCRQGHASGLHVWRWWQWPCCVLQVGWEGVGTGVPATAQHSGLMHFLYALWQPDKDHRTTSQPFTKTAAVNNLLLFTSSAFYISLNLSCVLLVFFWHVGSNRIGKMASVGIHAQLCRYCLTAQLHQQCSTGCRRVALGCGRVFQTCRQTSGVWS